LNAVIAATAGMRRFGSASLDLAWTASGRFDAYWERDLKAWDIAAGILLVREAGGEVSDLDGRDCMMDCGHILAANDSLHRTLLDLHPARRIRAVHCICVPACDHAYPIRIRTGKNAACHLPGFESQSKKSDP